MTESGSPTTDEWGAIGGEHDHSASSYDHVRDCVEMLRWPAGDQFTYLVEHGYPTTELLEQFFDVVPGWLPFLLARGLIDEGGAAVLAGFEQFLIDEVCPKPWGDDRDALDDIRWARARVRAAQVLGALPPRSVRR